MAKTARCVRALETPAGDGGSSSIEHRESFIHSMMLRAAGRQGWLLAVVGLLGLIRGSAAQSDEPPCADDPDGSLAAFGGCAAVVSMGCDLDLNTVSPDTPVGTIVSGLCPVGFPRPWLNCTYMTRIVGRSREGRLRSGKEVSRQLSLPTVPY